MHATLVNILIALSIVAGGARIFRPIIVEIVREAIATYHDIKKLLK